MGDWANYFVATAGGAAALAGLVFVSVSLNLKKILEGKHLPGRAMGSLILLGNILISGSLCLVPRQSLVSLGIELGIVCSIVWVVITLTDINMYRVAERVYKHYHCQNIVFGQCAILPFIAGVICLICGSFTGVYCLVAGISFSFIKSLTDSWVLLVEINR